MKITQLPNATAVTETDIAVIVQEGETRQIPRTLLAPPPPDDLQKDGNTIFLSVNGETVGNGVEIPNQPDGLQLDGNALRLTENGVPVGTGAELPTVIVDSEMSDTSENPVQNKVAKAYTDEKTKNTPTDLTLTDNRLQLTANGKAVGAGVTLPSGLRLINSISVVDGETATMLKISKDVDGANFSLHNIMFAARLNLPSAQTVTIRLRTNSGGRYLVYKTNVGANTILFVSGESKVFSLGTNTIAEYLTSTADSSGTVNGVAFQSFASNDISKTNISDIEIFLYDASNKFVELQAGSSVELWGC